MNPIRDPVERRRASVYRRLYDACKQLTDVRYNGCPFRMTDGTPCGSCTCCNFTPKAAAQAHQAIADADKMFGWDSIDREKKQGG